MYPKTLKLYPESYCLKILQLWYQNKMIITCTKCQAADSQEHGLYFFQQSPAAFPHILYYIQWSLTHDNTVLPIESQGTLIKEEKSPFDLLQVNAALTRARAPTRGLSPRRPRQTAQLQPRSQPERDTAITYRIHMFLTGQIDITLPSAWR